MPDVKHLPLQELVGRAWRNLATAVDDRDSPLRTPALATTDTEFGASVRTVVLRGVDASAGTLAFHTDQRSRKFDSIRRDPRVEMVFYDPRAAVQIRVRAAAMTHVRDDLARLHWERLSPLVRATYAVAKFESTDAVFPSGEAPVDSDPFDNFSVVVCTALRLDYLILDDTGNRRASFDRCNAGWSGKWVAP
jgi:hypothetical protein